MAQHKYHDRHSNPDYKSLLATGVTKRKKIVTECCFEALIKIRETQPLPSL